MSCSHPLDFLDVSYVKEQSRLCRINNTLACNSLLHILLEESACWIPLQHMKALRTKLSFSSLVQSLLLKDTFLRTYSYGVNCSPVENQNDLELDFKVFFLC